MLIMCPDLCVDVDAVTSNLKFAFSAISSEFL